MARSYIIPIISGGNFIMKQDEQSQTNNPHPKQVSNIQVNQSKFLTEYNIKIYIGLLIIFILFTSIIFSIKLNVSADQSSSNGNLGIANSHRNICLTNPMAPESNSIGVVINGNNNFNNNKLYSVQIAQIAGALNEINIDRIRSYVVLHRADLHNVNVHIKSNTLNPNAHEVNGICVVINSNNNKSNNQNKSKGKQSLNNINLEYVANNTTTHMLTSLSIVAIGSFFCVCYYALRTITLIFIQPMVTLIWLNRIFPISEILLVIIYY